MVLRYIFLVLLTPKKAKICLRLYLANPTVVDQKLANEPSTPRLAGPFTVVPFHPFRVSLLGLVAKNTIGEFNFIHHLSFPCGYSVNDGIATENTSMHYATVAGAICLIKLAGPGCFLAKTDVKNAFCIIPIQPSDPIGYEMARSVLFQSLLAYGCCEFLQNR